MYGLQSDGRRGLEAWASSLAYTSISFLGRTKGRLFLRCVTAQSVRGRLCDFFVHLRLRPDGTAAPSCSYTGRCCFTLGASRSVPLVSLQQCMVPRDVLCQAAAPSVAIYRQPIVPFGPFQKKVARFASLFPCGPSQSLGTIPRQIHRLQGVVKCVYTRIFSLEHSMNRRQGRQPATADISSPNTFLHPARRVTDLLLVANAICFAAQFLSGGRLVKWGLKVVAPRTPLQRRPSHNT